MTDKNVLRDGFQEMGTYTGGHKRSLRGCQTIGLMDERSQNLRQRDCILSWDANCVILWENGSVIHEIKFPKSKECYISSIAYISKLNVFFAPSMDMSFNIYDQRLRLIESISHEERVILGCNYDVERNVLVLSGGSGVSIWRIKKCSPGSQLESSNSFLVEKIYVIEGCSDWVSKLMFDSLHHKAFAISDSTVTVLNLRKRNIECVVSDMHETPITSCLWYPGDKFYITSCMSGTVKCWFMKEKLDSINPPENGTQVPVALHSFNAHSKAVSGLSLHPRPGLLITTGMDACVKVFDLEAFTMIQSIQANEEITHFNVGISAGYPVCLFALASGDMVMWKIDSCCKEFSTCTSDIVSLTSFENMNNYFTMHASQICYTESETLENRIGFARYDNQPNTSIAESNISKQDKYLKAVSISVDSQDRYALPSYIAELNKTTQERLPPATLDEDSQVSQDDEYDEHIQRNSCVVAFAGHDLQLMSVHGTSISRCSADSLIDGVTHFTFSVFQQLLFCILESGALRVFCTRSPSCILLREIHVGSLSSDKATTMTLVDGMALSALRSSATSKDMRGEPSPLNVTEAILIGTAEGNLLCFDTYQECALVLSQQVSKNNVEDLRYRPLRKELVVVTKISNFISSCVVKVFQVPDMILTHSFHVSGAYSCMAVSLSDNHVIVGCKEGPHQLFRLLSEEENFTLERLDIVKSRIPEATDDDSTFGSMTEILHQDSDHTALITGLSICDKLEVYATSSLDAAIKVWDFKKRCLKTILLDVPSQDVLFNWPVGNLLVTQREVVQSISYQSWKTSSREHDEDDETEWDGFDLEPQSSDIAVTAKTRISYPNSSKPHSGLTFLTDHDRDEIAEVAFLEAALEANGNLEDYWAKHSTLAGFQGKSKTLNRSRSKWRKEIGTKFNVRHPPVPIPPRRTKSNYFKRKSQKELEAKVAPQTLTERDDHSHIFSSEESDGSDEEEIDHFKSPGFISEATALEELVGRKEARGTASGKSLLIKTQSFARKISANVIAKRNSAFLDVVGEEQRITPTSRNATAGDSLKFFHAVQNAKARTSIIGSGIATAPSELREDGDEQVELFVKPNGPRGKKSYQRIRPKMIAVTAAHIIANQAKH